MTGLVARVEEVVIKEHNKYHKFEQGNEGSGCPSRPMPLSTSAATEFPPACSFMTEPRLSRPLGDFNHVVGFVMNWVHTLAPFVPPPPFPGPPW